MKDNYPTISLARICRLLGITRQAFYQFFWHADDVTTEEQMVLQKVKELRLIHPVMGTRKLYCLLQGFLLDHQIKMGRDALFDVLAANKLLVRKRKRRINTTQSNHWFKRYPNLTKMWYPQAPEQLWVADITYVPLNAGFLYLSLITDAYSHKIMGYHIAETLEAVHSISALKMAISERSVSESLIHHSDRGIQYCSYDYTDLLQENNILISMTQSGDPLENPIAERINGILKEEYLSHFPIKDQTQAMEILHTVVSRYNCMRPHQSINMLTPQYVHEQKALVNRRWGISKPNRNIVNQYQD